jgi:hypothetical protein
MKYYGIENLDSYYMQTFDELPLWSSADEGRLIYVKSLEEIYFGSSSGWTNVSSLSTSGYSGYSGVDGVEGESLGFSGYSGISGTDGLSGYSGYSAPNDIYDYQDVIGYIKLPNDIIINWGFVNTTINSIYPFHPTYYVVSFPVDSRFTRGLLYADASAIADYSGGIIGSRTSVNLVNTYIGSNAKNSIRFMITDRENTFSSVPKKFYWYAIGI